MGEECSMFGEYEKRIKNFQSEKLEGKRRIEPNPKVKTYTT
jgi:hypothetical protein